MELFGRLLEDKFDFDPRGIVRLTNRGDPEARPTRANIEREFERLAQVARSGDQVVILLAGHGSQQPNDNPDDPHDPEPDGMDEIFLPEDVGRWTRDNDGVQNAIRDDELRGWLARIRSRGTFVWIIVDSCHAGTMVRGNGSEVVRHIPLDRLAPSDVLDRVQARPRQNATDSLRSGIADIELGTESTVEGLVAMYAAQANEATVEKLFPRGAERDRQKTHGLFTYSLNQVLRQATGSLTYRELVKRVREQFAHAGRHSPTPFVEGADRDREVLGHTKWPARTWLTVRNSGGRLSLAAGELNGMTVGTVLAIHRPRGAPTSQADQFLGYAHIVDVDTLDSTIESYADERHAPGVSGRSIGEEEAWAKIVEYHFDLPPLRLAIEGSDPQVATVMESLERARQADSGHYAMVELSDDPGRADWLLRIDEGEAYLVPAAGSIVRDAASMEATVASESTGRFGPVALDSKLPNWCWDCCTRIARVNHLLSLAAPSNRAESAGASRVDLDIQMRHLGSCDVAEAIDMTEPVQLRVGDRVSFQFANRGRMAVDVTLVFVDSGFGVQSLFPRRGEESANRIEPGQDITRTFTVSSETTGLEHMLVIAVEATETPVDFAWLCQPTIEQARAVAGLRGGRTVPLKQLIEYAAYGAGTTRGLPAEVESACNIQAISWRVVP